jgi:hypothetical protein
MFVAKNPNPSAQDRAPQHGGCLDLRSLSFNYDTSFEARIMTTEKFQLRHFPVENRLLIIVTDEDLEPIDIGESESTTTASKIDITAESPSNHLQ